MNTQFYLSPVCLIRGTRHMPTIIHARYSKNRYRRRATIATRGYRLVVVSMSILTMVNSHIFTLRGSRTYQDGISKNGHSSRIGQLLRGLDVPHHYH